MPGRPRGSESTRRTHELLRLLGEGQSPADACRSARVSEKRFVRLIGEDDFFAVYTAIRSGQLGPTAVVLEPVLEEAA